MSKLFCMIAGLAASFAAAPATGLASVIYNEAVDGDLSNNRLSPTQIPLSAGSNIVSFSTSTGDREFFTVTIPAGSVVLQLELAEYESPDPAAFGAFMPGATFSDDPDSPNPAVYSGLALFGNNELGQDLLDDFLDSIGFDTLGFVIPLPEGQYTFWVQQLGPVSQISLNFVVVPTPATAGLLAASGLLLAGRRRRA